MSGLYIAVRLLDLSSGAAYRAGAPCLPWTCSPQGGGGGISKTYNKERGGINSEGSVTVIDYMVYDYADGEMSLVNC